MNPFLVTEGLWNRLALITCFTAEAEIDRKTLNLTFKVNKAEVQYIQYDTEKLQHVMPSNLKTLSHAGKTEPLPVS